MDQSLERWRPVVGYEGLYEVSDQGRVRSLDRVAFLQGRHKRPSRGRVLKPGSNRRGYVHVGLHKDGKRTTYTVHALVAQAFIGPRPEGMHVCHGPGGKADNSLANLRYGTPKENQADRHRDGTAIYGDTHPMAKLTEDQARWILSMKGVMTGTAMAQQLNVTFSQVCKVLSGAAWGHLPMPSAKGFKAGEVNRGRVQSAEERAKRSQSLKGRPKPPELRAKQAETRARKTAVRHGVDPDLWVRLSPGQRNRAQTYAPQRGLTIAEYIDKMRSKWGV